MIKFIKKWFDYIVKPRNYPLWLVTVGILYVIVLIGAFILFLYDIFIGLCESIQLSAIDFWGRVGFIPALTKKQFNKLKEMSKNEKP